MQQGSHSAIFLALQSDFFMVNFIIFVPVITSRRMRWTGHVARMEEGRDVYGVLLGKLEGKRPLGRPRHRWEDIKRNFQEMGCGVLTGSSWLKIGTGGGHL